MPGLNDRNPNQIQYGNIGGVVDNNAPQEADTTQKPPKIRKPLESYFFDDSTRSRTELRMEGPNLERATTVAISRRSTRLLNGFQNDYPYQRLQDERGLGLCWAIWAALRFRSISVLRPQYTATLVFAQAFDAYLDDPRAGAVLQCLKSRSPTFPISSSVSYAASAKRRLWATHAQNDFALDGFQSWTTRAAVRAGPSTNGRARGRRTFRWAFRTRARNTAIHAGYIYNMGSLKENGGILRDRDITDTVFERARGARRSARPMPGIEFKNNVVLRRPSRTACRSGANQPTRISRSPERSSVFFGHSFLYSRFLAQGTPIRRAGWRKART